ncbi:MAG: antibiotic biosynthesis monooxygenase [Halieaceae bacterium]|nr:antibiotic biosynthesis monooxygenase [Halieaceae bacterium]
MIIVAAQLTFSDETSRDHAVKKSTPVQLATREDEPGCLAYCFSADPCDPLSIQVYELWNDSDALVAHFDHPNYHEMLAVMSDAGVLESRNRAYLTERDEPVYGPDLEKKTAFFCDLSR